jgi:hypothetical protein
MIRGGARTGARILIEVGDGSTFPTAGHLAAYAALGDPASRAYYDKKIAQGKHHTQALLRLARRRADVLFAMLRDGTFYEPQPAAAT